MSDLQKIKDIMNTNLFTISIDDTLHSAYDLMKNECIRHLPVLDNNKLVGMLCERKVYEYILRQIYDPDENYGELAYNNIKEFENIIDTIHHFVYPEDSIAKAVRIAAKHKIEALPVVDWEMNLVGLITNTDLLLSYYYFLDSNGHK